MSLEADGSLGRGKSPSFQVPILHVMKSENSAGGSWTSRKKLGSGGRPGFDSGLSLTCCVNPWYISHSRAPQSPRLENTCSVGCQRLAPCSLALQAGPALGSLHPKKAEIQGSRAQVLS